MSFGSMHIGWVFVWLLWSIATLLFVVFGILPDMTEFATIVNSHPEVLARPEGWFVLVPQLLWFVLGILALVVPQACIRRLNRDMGLSAK